MAFRNHSVPASLRQQLETMRASTHRGPRPQGAGEPVVDAKVRSGFKVEALSLKTRLLRIPQEPEDAKLTGDTRSLDRRLLGLNLGGSLSRRVPGLAG